MDDSLCSPGWNIGDFADGNRNIKGSQKVFDLG